MTATFVEATPLDNAHNDLEQIDTEIAALQQRRSSVVAFIEMYPKYVRPIARTPSGDNGKMEPLSKRLGDFMAILLKDIVKPMTLAEFYNVLEQQALIPGGKDPKQAISAILGRDGRFRFTAGKGWDLQPTPAHKRGLDV